MTYRRIYGYARIASVCGGITVSAYRKGVTIYEPGSPVRRPLALFHDMFSDLLGSRNLAWQLMLRDIRAQYRQAALGLVWAFMLPAANATIWLFIRSTGVVSVPETSMPYAAFVISGTLLWAIFMDSVNAPLQQAQTAKPMLAKINFPYEGLILSGVGQACFNAAIRLVVMFAALLYLGVVPGTSIVLLPVVVLALILVGTAVGLVLVPIGMLYTDVGRGLPLLLQFLMFLCPVVYPIPERGIAAGLMSWNPLTHLLKEARRLLVGEWFGEPGTFAAISIGTLLVLLLGWLVYRAAMPVLIERMSS